MPEIIEDRTKLQKPPVMPKKYGLPKFKTKPLQDEVTEEPIQVEPEKVYLEVRKLK